MKIGSSLKVLAILQDLKHDSTISHVDFTVFPLFICSTFIHIGIEFNTS